MRFVESGIPHDPEGFIDAEIDAFTADVASMRYAELFDTHQTRLNEHKVIAYRVHIAIGIVESRISPAELEDEDYFGSLQDDTTRDYIDDFVEFARGFEAEDLPRRLEIIKAIEFEKRLASRKIGRVEERWADETRTRTNWGGLGRVTLRACS